MKTAREQVKTRNNFYITIILFLVFGTSIALAKDNIIIEAEDYKSGPNGIEVASSDKASNGEFVTQLKGNNTLVYSFKVDNEGEYDLFMLAANKNRDDATMDIEVNGEKFNNVSIARSFDWNVFQENKIQGVSLVSGKNTVKITQKLSLSCRPDK